jgi:phage shock protein E
MPKQNIKILIFSLITITMFSIFKSIFTKKDSTRIKELITNGAFLVDVRTPEEYSAGNVNGSTNIPLNQIQNQLTKFKGKNQIIVFCRSGNRSSQAKSILEKNGFDNVTNGKTWININEILSEIKNK